ncbi:MAG: gliding motility-associated C-terminal domain-containing protein [Bacteroidota bacterium]
MKVIITTTFVLLINLSLLGQDFSLLGLMNNELIKINPNTLQAEVLGPLVPVPEDAVRFLTFVEEECLFYAIVSGSDNPTLVTIDLDLNYQVIGRLTLPGEEVYFIEALSYNTTDNTLYAGVSLNGAIASGDFSSESIVKINRSTAVCEFVTRIIGNVSSPDIDRMSFCGNTVYFHDGQPGQWSRYFSLEFTGFGATVQAEELLFSNYIPIKDVECVENRVYYSTGRDLGYFDPTTDMRIHLGDIQMPSGFEGEDIFGIGINPIPDFTALITDQTPCVNDTVLIELEYPYEDVVWNNGSTGSSILAIESGQYWAEITYNSCVFITDTISLSLIENEEFNINSDTSICVGQTIILAPNNPQLEIMWSDGSTGNSLEVSESGTYWGAYEKEGCLFYSDTISVMVVENFVSIGNNIVLCEGESHTVFIEGVGFDVNWSNGFTGNPIEISEPGTYWAEFNVNNCESRTDTIDVVVIEPVHNELPQDTVICFNENIVINLDNASNVIWNDGTFSNTITIENEGKYWAQYSIDGCTYITDTIDVIVVGENFEVPSQVRICEGESYRIELVGVGQNVIWNDGTVGNILEVYEEGQYWAEINLGNCVVETNKISVTLVEREMIEIGSDTVVCGEEELQLQVLNSDLNYEWNTGEVSNVISVGENGMFWATGINSECPSSSDTIEVRFIRDPKVILDIDSIFCLEEIFDWQHSTYDITWYDANGILVETISESGQFVGAYTVEECLFDTDSLNVTFVDCSPCHYFIPNVISPNYDRVNDAFQVVFSETCTIDVLKISIFDRWGNLVGKSNENYWNGEFNAKPVENGVYTYLIDMLASDNIGNIQEVRVFGDVTVLK